MVAANTAADKIDTFAAIKPPPAPPKAPSLSRVAHKHNIAFERSVL